MTALNRLPDTVRSVADAARVDAAARRHEVPCADGMMVWRCWGAGRPVVLLHGGSGSWNHWVRNVAALVAAGRQVWAPDLPGFGESARPPSGNDADAVPEPLEAALQTLLGDVPVDAVGFSFGGMVGGFLAAQKPARIRRLVLVGAPALGNLPEWRIDLLPWAHLERGAEFDAVQRANLAALMLARPESVDDLAVALQTANVMRDRMKFRRLSRTDILGRTLPRTRCPVFGIWGAEDALYLGMQDRLAPILARVAPAFRWLQSIPGAGHWVQFESAAQFDRLLAQALDED
jgi:pimeloyl-ACP methyl ester carboxylesterase